MGLKQSVMSPGVLSCTSIPATLEPKFWDNVGSLLVGLTVFQYGSELFDHQQCSARKEP